MYPGRAERALCERQAADKSRVECSLVEDQLELDSQRLQERLGGQAAADHMRGARTTGRCHGARDASVAAGGTQVTDCVHARDRTLHRDAYTSSSLTKTLDC